VIVDASQLGPRETIHGDICIVGGGAAGITLARELGRAGRDVVLLESGGKKLDRAAQDLDRGTVLDPESHGPLQDYRRRRLGGATTAWGGRCVPFDEVDFETRPHVAHSGWPFGKRDLDAYYERAHAYCDLGAYAYAVTDALPAPARHRAMIPGLRSEELTMAALYRFSPPTNFGARYGDELGANPSVRAYLHATAIELSMSREGNVVEEVVAAAPGGRRLSVVAKRYVLAGGGLEVTRLLLASRRVQARGIGNEHDLVGRFYMCHVIHHVDIELAGDGIVWDYERTTDGVYCQRTLHVTEEAQRSQGLLNHRARVEHPDIADPDHRSGVLSAAYLAKSFLMRQAANPLWGDEVNVLSKGTTTNELVRPVQHLRNVATDVPSVIGFSKRWLFERVLRERKLPSVVIPSASNRYTLRIDAEQAPNPESRVMLGDECDAYGLPRLRVDWRHTGLDAESLERTSRIFDEALRTSGVGKARWSPPVRLPATGGHHIGTTRMTTDPRSGVVDPSCRVHGVGNLYIASSSVFPTSSYANPTLTVLALALRLADHLQRRSG